MKTFKEWYDENLSDHTQDILEHGCAGGFPGITYYDDTVELFEEYKDEIFEVLADVAEEQGYENIYQLLGTFNGDFMPWNYPQFANQLVWFMVEETAREKMDEEKEQ